MMYGTTFDEITQKRHMTGTGGTGGTRGTLSGLSGPTYTGELWIVDSTGNLFSGVYGRASGGLVGGNKQVAAQSRSGDFSYVTIRNTDDQSTTDYVIALRPTVTIQRGGTKFITYSPIIQSKTYTPPPAIQLQPGAPTSVTTVISAEIGRGTSTAIEAPTAPKPSGIPFPDLDPGFSYIIGPGETKFNAPGDNTILFTGNADSVGIHTPMISGTPAGISIGAGGFAPIPIPASEQYDRWEYRMSQVAGPDGGKIYYEMDFRNLSKNGPLNRYQFDMTGGSGSLGVPVDLISRVIVDVSTMGAAEIARAGAQKAGVSQEIIDKATEAGAILAITVATVGGLTVLSAPTAVAATAFPVAADAGSSVALIPATTTALEAAGSTLLPSSLSLVAPLSSTIIPAALESVAIPVASETISTSSLLTPAKVAVGAVEKAVATTAVATGTTALSAEIKKLTGQIPKAAQAQLPSQLPTGPSGAPTSSSGTFGFIAAGVVALLALTKKG